MIPQVYPLWAIYRLDGGDTCGVAPVIGWREVTERSVTSHRPVLALAHPRLDASRCKIIGYRDMFEEADAAMRAG